MTDNWPILLLGSACLLACGTPFSEQTELSPKELEQPLVAMDAWQELPAAEDPLLSHRPAHVSCPAGATRMEDGALEVQTGVCNYFSVQQPLLADLARGSVVSLQLWHEALDAPEPAVAHVAWLLGDAVAAEAEVAIPSEAALVELRATIAEPQAAGTRVALHLHNHGFNSYTFVGLTRSE